MANDDKQSPKDAAIDENLRRVFQPTLEEEVPDRFRDLLAKLKESDSGEKSGGDK